MSETKTENKSKLTTAYMAQALTFATLMAGLEGRGITMPRFKPIETHGSKKACRYSVNTWRDMKHEKIGRNTPCPCGSGRKYKNCCLPTAKPATKSQP